MITFTHGNLLKAQAEALVNTVNTVGVMGKGIALMFKEAFPENMRAYSLACKRKEIVVGKVFVTERHNWVGGPRWIVNFPTKSHWRNPSKIEWIEEGLRDLKIFIETNGVRSIALPPLGSGNGGLDWSDVRPRIESALGDLVDVDVIVYEPTDRYQNVAKAKGLETLTPARSMIAELVRRYSVLGFECTLLEIQKLAYLLERKLGLFGLDNALKLEFKADRFGPYAPKLTHLLNGLDGSYLHCGKRVADAGPLDVIWFEDAMKEKVDLYLKSEAKSYLPALNAVTDEIDGFESPVGMELLATVDWLLVKENTPASIDGIRLGLRHWLGGGQAAERKLALFDDALIGHALQRLTSAKEQSDAHRT
jgi:O-acetyl-ADP-ribose deacetylase (regulator of RNase III)